METCRLSGYSNIHYVSFALQLVNEVVLHDYITTLLDFLKQISLWDKNHKENCKKVRRYKL